MSLYVKVRKSRSVQAAHEQPADVPHAVENAELDLGEGSQGELGVESQGNASPEAEQQTQNSYGSDIQYGSDADQTQEASLSDVDRGNEGDSESEIKEAETGESCIEGCYVPRDPVEKPKVNEKVYVLYAEGGIFKIFEGVCEARTIGLGHTATGCERVRFDEGCFDVERNNIDTRKHYALLRCFITNAVLQKTKDEDIMMLDSDLRACKVVFDGRKQKSLQGFAGKIGVKLESSVLQKLITLIGQLHVTIDSKRTTPLTEYEASRESNIARNAAELARLDLPC